MSISKYLLLIALLSGCGIEDKRKEEKDARDYVPVNLVEWDGEYQERNDEFFVNYPPDRVLTAPVIEDIEDWWDDIKDCTGFDISTEHAPLAIAYIDDTRVAENVLGLIWLDLHYAEIYLNDIYNGAVTRHEMLHYLLYQAGVSYEENENHKSEYFSSCDVY